MLKTVIDYPKNGRRTVVIRQNLKGSYEKVNQSFQLNKFCAQEAVREVYMDEKNRNTY
jgi:MoxR-like ATPase